MEKEVDRLNSYALQYGTVKDQHTVIANAKTEVAREIFEDIYRGLFEMLPLKVFHLFNGDNVGDRFEAGKERALHDALHLIVELEKKYTILQNYKNKYTEGKKHEH